MRRLLFALSLLGIGFLAGVVLTGRAATERRPAQDDRMSLSDREDLSLPKAAADDAAVAAASVPPDRDQASSRRLAAELPDFADVASRTTAAVTNISVLQVTRTPVNPFFDDPFFRQFFGDDEDFYRYRERRGTSAGSGVIVSPDGHVLTNNHVLGDNVRDVTVVLGDRRSRDATIVGIDPFTDLALLKINGQNLPTVPWGDSSRLRVAEWVLAIGNPYQIGQTVTLGIVSAVGRTNVNISAYEDFIQTDAAINPGNSGGALINSRGELVGINTAIFSQSGGYQGIGFAVPSNLARRVLEDLTRYGEVRRGSIGTLRTVTITEELARDLGLDKTTGVLVWEMNRGAPAYRAGLRPGDVIEAFNDAPVTDPGQFFRLVSDTQAGSVVTLRIRRENRTVDLKVPVEQMPSTRRRAAAN